MPENSCTVRKCVFVAKSLNNPFRNIHFFRRYVPHVKEHSSLNTDVQTGLPKDPNFASMLANNISGDWEDLDHWATLWPSSVIVTSLNRTSADRLVLSLIALNFETTRGVDKWTYDTEEPKSIVIYIICMKKSCIFETRLEFIILHQSNQKYKKIYFQYFLRILNCLRVYFPSKIL